MLVTLKNFEKTELQGYKVSLDYLYFDFVI